MVDKIAKSGLDYRVTAMGTQIEGELDAILEVVKQCEAVVEEDSERFYTVLTMDYQRDRTGNLEYKVKAVEDRLGHPVKK